MSLKVVRTITGVGGCKDRNMECVHESLGDLRVQNFTAFEIYIGENSDKRQLERHMFV